MSWFSKVEPQSYALSPHDTRTLTYLSTTNAGWLPVLSLGGLWFTSYCVYRVRKKFGLDLEILAVDPICTYQNPGSSVSMMILFCLSQCNFEQWAREGGMERPACSKPKPKPKSRECMHLPKCMHHSKTLHLRLSASKRLTPLWSCVHHFETAYAAVKAMYATLRHIPHIARFFHTSLNQPCRELTGVN